MHVAVISQCMTFAITLFILLTSHLLVTVLLLLLCACLLSSLIRTLFVWNVWHVIISTKERKRNQIYKSPLFYRSYITSQRKVTAHAFSILYGFFLLLLSNTPYILLILLDGEYWFDTWPKCTAEWFDVCVWIKAHECEDIWNCDGNVHQTKNVWMKKWE